MKQSIAEQNSLQMFNLNRTYSPWISGSSDSVPVGIESLIGIALATAVCTAKLAWTIQVIFKETEQCRGSKTL